MKKKTVKKKTVKKKPVRKREFLYGEPANKVLTIRLTETEFNKVKKLAGKVKDRTITEWFKKISKL